MTESRGHKKAAVSPKEVVALCFFGLPIKKPAKEPAFLRGEVEVLQNSALVCFLSL
jgi:hypothetical protein